MELQRYTNFSFWNETGSSRSWLQRLFHKTGKRVELKTPSILQQSCKGLVLNGKEVKSILFSTDLALIENNDSDALLAVYPFTPSVKIMETLINFSNKPVICGIGGGKTQGKVAVEKAVEAEQLGACAVIVNQPFKNRDIIKIKKRISIPVISSVSTLQFDFEKRIAAGISAFHITGGSQTIEIISFLKQHYPDLPFICTGGKSLEHIEQVAKNEPNAIVLTPPSNANLFKEIMASYRKGINKVTIFRR